MPNSATFSGCRQVPKWQIGCHFLTCVIRSQSARITRQPSPDFRCHALAGDSTSTVHRHLARPGNGVCGNHRPVRGLVFGELRQVEEEDIRRAENHGPGQRGRARIAGWQVIGGTILADGLDAPAIGIGDGHKAQFDFAAVMDQPDHVGGVEGQP